MIHRISLSGSAINEIVRVAIQGYEAPYKEERLGILLGRFFRGIAQVEQAIIYGGGKRTRSEATVDPHKFERRVNDLQHEMGLSFLGSFHTHNEIASTISSTLSQADKTPLCENLPALIEVIAAIWVSNGPLRQAQSYLQMSTDDGYRVRMAGYGCQQGFECLPVWHASARSA